MYNSMNRNDVPTCVERFFEDAIEFGVIDVMDVYVLALTWGQNWTESVSKVLAIAKEKITLNYRMYQLNDLEESAQEIWEWQRKRNAERL